MQKSGQEGSEKERRRSLRKLRLPRTKNGQRAEGGKFSFVLSFPRLDARWRTRRSLLKSSEQMKWNRGIEIAGVRNDSELYGAIFRRGQEFVLRYWWTRVIGALFFALALLSLLQSSSFPPTFPISFSFFHFLLVHPILFLFQYFVPLIYYLSFTCT